MIFRIRRNRILWALCFVLIFFVIGCKESSHTPAISVNGQGFSREYIQVYLENELPDNATKEQRHAAIKALINSELMRQKVDKLGLDRELKLQVALDSEVRRRMSTAYKEYLFTNENVLEKARSYYRDHLEEYSKDVREIGMIITYTHVKGDAPVDDARAKGKIMEAYKALQSGMEFSRVAQKYSEDNASVEKGGSIGEVSRDALPKEISSRSFGIKIGDYSSPVRTAAGYAIVSALSDRRRVTKSFNGVKNGILRKIKRDIMLRNTKALHEASTVHIAEGVM